MRGDEGVRGLALANAPLAAEVTLLARAAQRGTFYFGFYFYFGFTRPSHARARREG